MTSSGISTAVHSASALVVLAAIVLAGCNRNTDSVSTAPPAERAMPSMEYPSPASTAAPQAAPTTAGLQVTVSLSPTIAAKAAPNDTVFIFARAAQGPRLPLAIVRKQVKDLPATIVLDDSQAMSPEMKLSSVPEVVVVARVSKSGLAGAQAGDLEGVSGPVKRGTPALTLSIANVVTGR